MTGTVDATRVPARERVSFKIELPLVPSLNNAYANNPRGGRYPTKQVLDWKDEAGWIVRLANPPKIRGPYKLTVLVPADCLGDVDNRVKIASDLLSKEMHVIPDDRKAIETTARRDKNVPPGRCVVVVESAA